MTKLTETLTFIWTYFYTSLVVFAIMAVIVYLPVAFILWDARWYRSLDGFEEYYSKQEIEWFNKLKAKLLESMDGNKD